MIKIIIDSSALRQANAAQLSALSAFEVVMENGGFRGTHARYKIAEVLIPELVQDELRTHLIQQTRDCKKSIDALRRNILLPESDKRLLQEFSDTLRHLGSESNSRTIMSEWLSQHAFGTVVTTPSDLKGALTGYFSGNLPYKAIKDRASIPDAVIYQGICRCLTDKDTTDPDIAVHFICHDNALREAAAHEPSVITHKRLADFLRSDTAKRLTELASHTDLNRELEALAEQYVERWGIELRQLCLALVDKDWSDWVSDVTNSFGVFGRKRVISVTPTGEPTNLQLIDGKVYGPDFAVFDVTFSIDVIATLEVPHDSSRASPDEMVYVHDGRAYQHVVRQDRIDVHTDIYVYMPSGASIRESLSNNVFREPYIEAAMVELHFKKP